MFRSEDENKTSPAFEEGRDSSVPTTSLPRKPSCPTPRLVRPTCLPPEVSVSQI